MSIGNNVSIHPTAIVSENAIIGDNCQIGPWVIIGDEVELGADCKVEPNVVFKGPSKIGARNHFFSFSTIGEDCQDKKFHGERAYLEVGDDNIFRESCTLHRGSESGGSYTRIGSRNLLMVGTHIAHDCQIGDDCVFANNVSVAGHVHVGDFAIVGGHTAIHQFTKIGAHAFIGGCSGLNSDVPPYIMAAGSVARAVGLNQEGLRRRGFSSENILSLKKAYRTLYFKSLKLNEAIELISEMDDSVVVPFADFLKDLGSRALVRPRR